MSLFELAIGWLAPSRCITCEAEGSILCEICSATEIIPFGERCWRCGSISPRAKTCDKCRRLGPLNHVWASTDYEGTAQELVKDFKFGQQREAANPIARLMCETFLNFNSDEDILKMNYLVIPIPTATKRARQRGFDHAKLLARQIATQLKLESYYGLLRHGQSRQVGSRRADRLVQAIGNYRVIGRSHVTGRNILLVDDVITTGGTLNAAAKALRQAGAKQVDGLVFAKRL